MTVAAGIATELGAIAQKLRDSTVEIRNRSRNGGSGVIWSAAGLIVTNAHVVGDSKATVKLTDGRVLEAEVIAKDQWQDLAALRVKAKDLPAATVGNSQVLRPGELVLAVGSPWGFSGVATGIIHSQILKGNPETEKLGWHKRRPLRRGKCRGNTLFTDWTQRRHRTVSNQPESLSWVVSDLRLAPGNSGGPLANARGQVIGINAAIAGGLALAVPSQKVERFLQSIEGNNFP